MPTVSRKQSRVGAQFGNYQIAAFEGYMQHNIDTLHSIHDAINTVGLSHYDRFWEPQSQVQDLDATPLWQSMLTTLIGFVPVVGDYYSGVADFLDSLGASDLPSISAGPNMNTAWDDFNAGVFDIISQAATGMFNFSYNVTQSNAVLTDILANGQWSFEGIEDPAILPDFDATIWPQVRPFLVAKIAMSAMKAHDVFFKAAPVSVLYCNNHPPCSQAIADYFAYTFTANAPSTVAWCTNDNQVIIPLTGYNMQVYNSFPNVTSDLNTTSQAILEPSDSCYTGFGVDTTYIQLYSEPPLLPNNVQTLNLAFDMTQPCAWSVPICDWSTWNGILYGQFPPLPDKNGQNG